MMGIGEHEIGTWPPALEALYRSEYSSLVRTARMIVGSTAVAEELTHDAFMRVHRAWDRVEQPAAFVRTVLVNLCRTWLGRASREEVRHMDDDSVTLPPELDETWRLVQSLPDKYRVALALRFYADLPEATIAELMECRVGTVRSLIHRGIAKLRKEMT